MLSNTIIDPGAALSFESENNPGFEGPEKLLEIWFNLLPYEGEGKFGLKSVTLDEWKEVLALVNCEILNIVRNQIVDSYLLSESSMFVYSNKVVLKTCGTTTLLKALPRVLQLAEKYLGKSDVAQLFYSRKAFMFPEKQKFPHSDWQHEVDFLDSYFEKGGAPYKIGRTNGEHWFLYAYQPVNTIKSVSDTDLSDDYTIEILMTGLDVEHSKIFYNPKELDGLTGGKIVADAIGLSSIYSSPKLQPDPYLFEPCGFSMNALLEQHYFNVHVTPEPHCSYASFETNIPVEPIPGAVDNLVQKVIECFKPNQFCVTLFRQGEDGADLTPPKIKGYQKVDSVLYDLIGYSLRYVHYRKM